MARQVFKDFSASTVQVVLNQLLGLVIFYITSRYLAKEIFGELNWSLAAVGLLISVAGLGIELMIVRKIAAGENVRETAGLYFTHVLFTGFLLILLLLLFRFIVPGEESLQMLLPGILLSQVLSFFASPFKQVANGKSLFRQLALMSTAANLFKSVLLIACVLWNKLSVTNVILIFVISAVAEFLVSLFLTIRNTGTNLFPLYWNFEKYKALIRESRPQFGVTVLNVVVARFDWILLGILTTSAITAEYSFAFKVFELCRLPLLAISPVLIPLFIRVLGKKNSMGRTVRLKMNLLFRAEMIISVMLPLLVASCWTPLMDSLTDGKYGAINETVFLLLALCIPLQFATDYYWNMCFAQQQLRLTFFIALGSATVNIVLNLLLIPLYGAQGAALAYIACFGVQLILFYLYTRQDKVKPKLILLLKTMVCAAVSLILVKQFTTNPIWSVPFAVLTYIILAMITQLVEFKKIRTILAVIVKH